MAPPTLRQLKMLLAAIDTGSISAAARALGVTQPAATQQLRELERGLGVRLLERARGRVIATAAGETLLASARRAQDAVEDVVSAARRLRTGDIGRVRLGTGATACIHLLPPTLSAVKRRMPGLEIVVFTANTPEILRRIEAGALDIALVTAPRRLSHSLAKTRIAIDPLVAVIPEALAPKRAAISAAEIARLPLILYETGGGTRQIMEAWFRRAGVAPQPIMELDNVEAIKVLVASGLGASIVPELAVKDGLRGAVVLPLRPASSRELAYVLRKDKVMDRGLRVFIQELGRAAKA
jgi:DNA-binding transcriptional LysR family regulator